ncbi:MBL fold metallo-hydrolase [Sulfurisphaera tokodaii]|uniref:Metallo-beta-lactamase fold-containing protein ST1585 n=2 Tax=Sulfurisphaera tokodaii TaxID=111955 RepID=MBLFP_SULTO|nr:MBL fold metallo-hydrolase [Sulfurisphaera tokodaii]Q970L2.1 RecName: Full=Metallo-beta-lactamase fold-containing protein ST1585; AltName: Full=Putative quorum sensing signal protein STK_15850 [Sulfurisphaera tokodaii str. 7]BAB66661.1 hypothetical protein STK_15850 [Sulfurisphaera tokodaii str. 7]HII73519.1 MBL fold metallo-hydrolase [Sulfurisphaera tokodaii]
MPCRGLHSIPAGPVEFPEIATVYVMCGEKLTVMIDAGVSNSIADFSFLDKLDYIVLTHLHIDHIGLLPELLQVYKAKVLVKSGFKKYLTSEDGLKKLNESAEKVLGDLYYVYGGLEKKLDQDKVIEVEGNEEFDLGGYRMRLIYTPGHARHHMSVLVDDFLFTGDSAGAYFNGVVIPTTPPVIDYKMYMESLKRQIELKPKVVGFAHGGLVSPKIMEEHLKQMLSKEEIQINVDIGGVAGEILRKQIEVNLRGLRESKKSI